MTIAERQSVTFPLNPPLLSSLHAISVLRGKYSASRNIALTMEGHIGYCCILNLCCFSSQFSVVASNSSLSQNLHMTGRNCFCEPRESAFPSPPPSSSEMISGRERQFTRKQQEQWNGKECPILPPLGSFPGIISIGKLQGYAIWTFWTPTPKFLEEFQRQNSEGSIPQPHVQIHSDSYLSLTCSRASLGVSMYVSGHNIFLVR